MPSLISALNSQVLKQRLRVLVLANNCEDETAAIAALSARGIELRIEAVTLPPDRAHAGGARRMAMEAGASWLRMAGQDGVLISTDADAVPPPHWAAETLRGFDSGAEIVGGQIRLPQHPLPAWLTHAHAGVARYWAAVRALADRLDPVPHDPAPRHGDHTGASLAITLAAHDAAGGVPPVPSGEDRALVAAVERQGGRVRHAPGVWTTVSIREDGRATGGMAAELRYWRELTERGQPYLLPGASHWRAVCQRRNRLRQSYLADPGIAPDCVNDIAYVSRTESALPELPLSVQEIGIATEALERMVG